jgi:long-chain acyl-CoA synthetase
MSSNLAANLIASTQRAPDDVAMKLDDVELTFADLDERSARVAGHLAAVGIGAGDRVGLMLPNVPDFAAIYYGILRLGAVVVPMNVLLKERETSFYLSDPGAKAVFAWSDFAEAAAAGAREAGAELITVAPREFGALLDAAEPFAEVADRDGSDTAVILYTSGTTGTPKGAELTHGNLSRNVEIMSDTFAMSGGEDVILGSLPLFHSFGQTCSLNCGVRSGATLSMLPRFDPVKALEIIERDGVTLFMGVPTMYGALLNAPNAGDADTSSLRLCVSGGASLPVELMRAFEAHFGCTILEGYGLSETSPVASFNVPDARKPGSIGKPIPGVDMRVVDDAGDPLPDGEVGEIAIRGHNIMKGYWNRPEATAEAIRDGWFHSGDMAKVDEDGFFFIVDRKKDLIIRGGYNVYPREIEEVIYEHPAVAEAAVVGVAHDDLGEEVAAFIALKPGAEASADELKAHCKDQVAAYKYPRHVWLIDELPKGPTGKILKRELKPPA